MPTLSIHAGFGDDALREQWTALLDADPEASVFQGPRFLRTWHDVLGSDHDVTTVALHDGDELVGIVVEAQVDRDGRRVLEFAGGTEVTDYQGPVARPDAAKDLATAWAERLATLDVDELALSGLADDTGWPDLLATALQARGLEVDEPSRIDVAPVVDVSAGHEAWLEALSGKDRKEHRRKARRLARDLGDVEVVTADDGDLGDAIARFFTMNDDAASHKASFFDRDDMRAFFDALATEFAHDDVFRLHELTVAGRPVAANVSLVWRDRWGLYNSAFDPRMASFSTGNVLVAELVALAADEGLDTFDFLRGDESYKYRFGAVDRDVVAITARASGR